MSNQGVEWPDGNQREASLVNTMRNDGAVTITSSLSKALLGTAIVLVLVFTVVTHATSQTWIQLSPTEGHIIGASLLHR